MPKLASSPKIEMHKRTNLGGKDNLVQKDTAADFQDTNMFIKCEIHS